MQRIGAETVATPLSVPPAAWKRRRRIGVVTNFG